MAQGPNSMGSLAPLPPEIYEIMLGFIPVNQWHTFGGTRKCMWEVVKQPFSNLKFFFEDQIRSRCLEAPPLEPTVAASVSDAPFLLKYRLKWLPEVEFTLEGEFPLCALFRAPGCQMMVSKAFVSAQAFESNLLRDPLQSYQQAQEQATLTLLERCPARERKEMIVKFLEIKCSRMSQEGRIDKIPEEIEKLQGGIIHFDTLALYGELLMEKMMDQQRNPNSKVCAIIQTLTDQVSKCQSFNIEYNFFKSVPKRVPRRSAVNMLLGRIHIWDIWMMCGELQYGYSLFRKLIEGVDSAQVNAVFPFFLASFIYAYGTCVEENNTSRLSCYDEILEFLLNRSEQVSTFPPEFPNGECSTCREMVDHFKDLYETSNETFSKAKTENIEEMIDSKLMDQEKFAALIFIQINSQSDEKIQELLSRLKMNKVAPFLRLLIQHYVQQKDEAVAEQRIDFYCRHALAAVATATKKDGGTEMKLLREGLDAIACYYAQKGNLDALEDLLLNESMNQRDWLEKTRTDLLMKVSHFSKKAEQIILPRRDPPLSEQGIYRLARKYAERGNIGAAEEWLAKIPAAGGVEAQRVFVNLGIQHALRGNVVKVEKYLKRIQLAAGGDAPGGGVHDFNQPVFSELFYTLSEKTQFAIIFGKRPFLPLDQADE